MAAGSDEHARSVPPGVRAAGLARDLTRLVGVRGVAVTDGDGDGGGGMGVFVGFAGGRGGDGVLRRGEDMVAVTGGQMKAVDLLCVSLPGVLWYCVCGTVLYGVDTE